MFLCLLETSLLLDLRCTSLHFWSVCVGGPLFGVPWFYREQMGPWG